MPKKFKIPLPEIARAAGIPVSKAQYHSAKKDFDRYDLRSVARFIARYLLK